MGGWGEGLARRRRAGWPGHGVCGLGVGWGAGGGRGQQHHVMVWLLMMEWQWWDQPLRGAGPGPPGAAAGRHAGVVRMRARVCLVVRVCAHRDAPSPPLLDTAGSSGSGCLEEGFLPVRGPIRRDGWLAHPLHWPPPPAAAAALLGSTALAAVCVVCVS